MFTNHDVDAALLEQGDVAPAAEIAVCQHHIPSRQRIVQRAKQAVLAGLLPLILADRCLQYRADGQREDHQDPHNRKPTARRLAGLLRILRLIGRRVGHRQRGAIHVEHPPSQPEPILGHHRLDFPPRISHQLVAGRFGQVFSGRAICSGLRRTRRQTLGQPPAIQSGDRLAARMVGAQTLRQKGPHRDGRRVDPSLP
jgi:hypothetical protein